MISLKITILLVRMLPIITSISASAGCMFATFSWIDKRISERNKSELAYFSNIKQCKTIDELNNTPEGEIVAITGPVIAKNNLSINGKVHTEVSKYIKKIVNDNNTLIDQTNFLDKTITTVPMAIILQSANMKRLIDISDLSPIALKLSRSYKDEVFMSDIRNPYIYFKSFHDQRIIGTLTETLAEYENVTAIGRAITLFNDEIALKSSSLYPTFITGYTMDEIVRIRKENAEFYLTSSEVWWNMAKFSGIIMMTSIVASLSRTGTVRRDLI